MSTELAVAIIGLTSVAIPSAVEIWKAARRRKEKPGTPAPPATAQPLREEAAELLSEVYMIPLPYHPRDVEGMEAAFEGFKARRNKLVQISSRLSVNSGISDEEDDAFRDAAASALNLGAAVSTLIMEYDNGKGDELDEEMAAIELAQENLHAARARFELVAREASRAG